MKGHINPLIAAARDEGKVPDDLWIGGVTLILRRTERQQADLDELLEQQQQPSSPMYRKWLTPDEFANRFAFSPDDIANIRDWLTSQGLSVQNAARSRGWVTFGGPAGRIARALGTEIHYYNVGGERHYANAGEPSLPKAIQQVALGFDGLTSIRPKPVSKALPPAPRRLAEPASNCDDSAESGPLTPPNFATIYDINPLYSLSPAIDGSFQTVAVVGEADPAAIETGTSTIMSDVNAFRKAYGLPAVVPAPGGGTRPAVVLMASTDDPSDSSNNDNTFREANLDLDWSGAIAPNAQIIYAYKSSAFDAARMVIDNDLAPVMSMSYGTCEPDAGAIVPAALRALAQQGNAEGITWVAASGDTGPAECDVHHYNPEATNGPAVWLPASIPEVTSVGGTEFVESMAGSGACLWSGSGMANGYIPEEGWNDTALTATLLASGGGPSKVFTTKPNWQLGLGLDTARDVPDLAFAASGAHDPYAVYYSGALHTDGGTSLAAPSFAGILALLNQHVSPSAPSAGLGDMNPSLYGLAQSHPLAFHDVTMGNNLVPCGANTPGCPAAKVLGSSAGPGYDEVTGLGSLDVFRFLQDWNSGALTTTAVAIPPSSSQGPFTLDDNVTVTATVSAAASAGVPTGTVNFFLPAAQCTTGLSTACADPTSLGSVALTNTNSPPSATLKLNPGQLPLGSDTIEAVYSGDSAFQGSYGTAVAALATVAGQAAVVATVGPLVGAACSASTAIAPNTAVQEGPAPPAGYNWEFCIQLQNSSPVPATLNAFSLGTPSGSTTSNTSLSIAETFGGAVIPASGILAGTYGTNSLSPPETLVFAFMGTDANGNSWSTQASVEVNGASGEIAILTNGATFDQVELPVGSANPPPDAAMENQNVFAPGMALTLFSRAGAGAGECSAPDYDYGLLATFCATSILPLQDTLVSKDGSQSVSATINGTAAPLYYVSPAQINLQIPYELQASLSASSPTAPAVLQLDNSGVVSTYSFTLYPVAPGIFINDGVWSMTPDGQEPVSVNNGLNPVSAGSTVGIYYTGAGALSGTVADGAAATPGTPPPLSKATVTLSGNGIAPLVYSNAPPDNSLTVAMLPGAVGVAQAVFQLPLDLKAGLYSVSIALQGTVGSGTSLTVLPAPEQGNTVSICVGSPCSADSGPY